jgi:phage-related tail fiber protein
MFQTILTLYGLQQVAAAIASGVPINLTQMAVGDGGGSAVTPSTGMTALVNERYRAAANRVQQDPANPTRYYVELLIPATVGGWTIREYGIFDAAGNLFAVGNFPASYKTLPSDGASSDLAIRAEISVSNAGVITLIIDPALAIATQAWVTNNITGAALIPGGTTGQVLTKQSNTSGDFDWENPADANILVDAVEEPEVVLAAGQQTVNLTVTNTTGLAVYLEGVRIFRGAGVDDWQQGANSTQVVLGKSYPAGTRFRAAQNEPASNIPDPLTRSNNLSDLQNVATARANLGVLSAADSAQLQPAGNIAFTARATPPAGWLVANGAAISRAVYATLFAAIGTAYGAGDGSTTFNLPDLRGEFIRGHDAGRGVDTGRALGSGQLDALQNITGSLAIDDQVAPSLTGAFLATSSYPYDANSLTSGAGRVGSFDASRVARTAAETRPRNVAMLPIIKW